MSKILLVSSFNERIYKLSGIRLIQSFIEHNISTDFLITTEGEYSFDKLNEISQKYSTIKLFNMNHYDYLNNWLEENKDIIPVKYNGLFENNNHIDDNINIKLLNNFNQKASLWFRKIASLKYALDNFKNEYDYIIWIDADTAFLKPLSNDYIIEQFNSTNCFYHLGLERAKKTLCSIESGFIGFKKKHGYKLIQMIVNEYCDKKFIKYLRWDDGHIMGQVIINSNIKSFDVAIYNTNRCMHPMNHGPFNKYIIHFKGSHHCNEKYKFNIPDYEIYENKILENQYIK